MYSPNPFSGAFAFFAMVGVAIGLFLLLRAVVLWYFRINEIYNHIANMASEAETTRYEIHKIRELLEKKMQ